MSRQLYRLMTISRQMLPVVFLWIPRVMPWSVSLLQAPLPTAVLLFGWAQRAVALRINARKFGGRL